MSVYLIDYENVHFGGLEGIEKLSQKDEVVLFYGDNASTIPMELHIKVASTGAKIHYIRIDRTGKNYLDFQLSAMSGYLVGTTEQTEFVVISKDTGYDAVLDLWNGQEFVGRSVHFIRRESIDPEKRAIQKTSVKAKAKKSTTNKEKSQKEQEENKTEIKETEKKKLSKKGKQTEKNLEKRLKIHKPDLIDAVRDAFSDDEPKTEEKIKKPEKKVKKNEGAPAISNANKAAIRNAVREFALKPTDYTKIYRVFQAAKDKHEYNIALVRQLKDQELGNKVYKATLKTFSANE